ncbi:MAG: PQQ-binding-like beta-propeller repeat protein [Planctomycetaceae bacterium]
MSRRFENRSSRFPRNAVFAVAFAACMSGVAFSQQQPQNPLNRLFNNIDKSIRGEEEINGRNGRDAFDIRTPQNPDNARRLSEAERYIRSERWNDAVEVLQFLLDQPQDSLIFGRGRKEWSSLRRIASDMLRDLPEPGRRSYQSRFGPLAERILNDGLKNQDESLLHEAVRRFGVLPAGMEARRHLISLLIARGDVESAARLLEEFPGRDHPTESIRLAVCLAMISEIDVAVKLLNQTPGWQAVVGTADSTTPDAWLAGREIRSEEPVSANEMGTPLLIPAWSAKRIARFHIEEQVGRLERDLADSRRGILPMSQAVFAGDLMIYRDLAGIKARSITTGELVWQNLPDDNLESRLVSNTEFSDSNLWQNSQYVEDYEFSRLDHHPLGTALFRDAVTSGMTADGGRLYSIERQNPLESLSYNYYWQRQNAGQESPAWAVNELVCRQATSGRRLWSVGGPEIEPLFSRPLAGAYFLGAPILFENQLLVLADFRGEIQLYALSPSTGEPLWNQLVATAGRPLAEDPVRRMWRCQPVVANGQILCPTGVGWLVALDAYSHSISWVYRYPPHDTQRRRFRSGYTMNSVQPLLQRWGPQPPIVGGDRILLTPTELPDEFNSIQPSLICLDGEGKLAWQVQKQDALYVAGVFNEYVVVVTRAALKAYSLDDGAPVWETKFTDELGLPCGRGVALDGHYLIPFADGPDGRIGRFHLQSGELQNVISVPNPTEFQRLGNLHIQSGRLASLSAESVAVFPSVDMERAQWSQLGKTNPRRVLREAQLLISQDKHDEALAVIDSVSIAESGKWKPDEQTQLRTVTWNVLRKQVLPDGTISEGTLERLRELSRSPSERRTVERLFAARLETAGRFGDAARIYLEDVTQPSIEFINEVSVSARPDTYSGGRLRKLLENAPEDEREQILLAINEIASATPIESSKSRDQIALSLSFLPVGCQVQLELADAAALAGQITEAALRYRRVVSVGLPEQKLRALFNIAQLYDTHGAPEEALTYWSELASRNDLPEQLVDGRNRRAIAREHLDDWSVNRKSTDSAWESIWQSRELIVDMTSGQRQRGVSRLVDATSERWRFLYQADVERLQIEDKQTGELVWSLPLRSLEGHVTGSGLGVSGNSTCAVVTHQGVIHALGVPDQRILWRYSPNMRDEGPQRLRGSYRTQMPSMRTAASFLTSDGVRSSGRNGFILAANEFVVVLQLRDIVVLDAVTGEMLWRELNNHNTSSFILVGNTIFQYDQSGTLQQRDATNGMFTKSGTASTPENIGNVLQIRGADLITLSLNTDEASDGNVLKRSSLADNTPRWSQEFVKSALYSMVGADEVAVLEGDGRLVLVNLESGELREIGSIPQQLMSTKSAVSVVSDPQRLYVVVKHGRFSQLHLGMPSMPANGTIFAFTRTGAALWTMGPDFLEAKQDEDDKNQQKTAAARVLALPDFEQSPVMVLLGETVERPNGLFFRQLRVTCVDKQTGKVLLDWNRPTDQNGFHSMKFDQLGGWLELDSSGFRLRIHPNEEVAEKD